LKTAHYVDLLVTPKNHSQRLRDTFEVQLFHVSYSRSGALSGDARPVRNGRTSEHLGAVKVEAVAARSAPPRGGSPGYYVPVNFHVESGVPAGAKVSVSMYFPTCAQDIGKREFTLGAVPETVSWKFGVINDSFRCFTTTTRITYEIYLSAPGDGFWAAGVEAVQRLLSKSYNADSRGCGAASPASRWESTCEYKGGEAINIYFKTRHK
jgi:hypothetical protein